MEDTDDAAVEAVSSKVDVMMANDGIKSYSCDKCEYWSKYKQHLQRHTLSIHDGVTYQCK